MNRAERRLAEREDRRRRQPGPIEDPHGAHLDCGCTVRQVVPIFGQPVCSECGRPSEVLTAEGSLLPTAAAIGEIKIVHLGCYCGWEYSVSTEVRP